MSGFWITIRDELGGELECLLLPTGVVSTPVEVLCNFFGYKVDERLCLYTDDILAAREGENFSFTTRQFLLLRTRSEDDLFIAGNRKEASFRLQDLEGVPARWRRPRSPVCRLKQVAYTGRHAETVAYLRKSVTPARLRGTKNYKKRKAWRQHCKRRYKLEKDGYLRRIPRKPKHKNGTSSKDFCRAKHPIVLPHTEAVALLAKWHAENHDGFNRLEERFHQLYVTDNAHAAISAVVGDNCATGRCAQFRTPHRISETICTSRPMQLVMFDLVTMPMSDACGNKHFLLIKDHFTKFHWGRAFRSKESPAIAEFLFKVFADQGAPERFSVHASNCCAS